MSPREKIKSAENAENLRCKRDLPGRLWMVSPFQSEDNEGSLDLCPRKQPLSTTFEMQEGVKFSRKLSVISGSHLYFCPLRFYHIKAL